MFCLLNVGVKSEEGAIIFDVLFLKAANCNTTLYGLVSIVYILSRAACLYGVPKNAPQCTSHSYVRRILASQLFTLLIQRHLPGPIKRSLFWRDIMHCTTWNWLIYVMIKVHCISLWIIHCIRVQLCRVKYVLSTLCTRWVPSFCGIFGPTRQQ